MASLNDLVKVEQLAKKLNVSRDTIEQWKKQGMPSVKIGRFVFISQNSFLRWARSHEITDDRQDAPG